MDYKAFDKLGRAPPASDEAEQRDLWRRGMELRPGENTGAPGWAVPIEQLDMLRAKYADRITPRRYGPDGQELLSSKMRRAVEAVVLAKQEAPYEGRLGMREGEEGKPWTYQAWRKTQGIIGGYTETEIALYTAKAQERFASQLPEAMRQMHVPERFITDLGDLVDTEPVQHVRRWVANPSAPWAFILSGAGGTGKSMALVEALHQACQETIAVSGVAEPQWRTRKGRYTHALEFLSGPAFGPAGEEHYAKHAGVPVLCLDDIGTEMLNDVQKQLLARLLDERWSGKRRTLIATNLTWPDLVARYGARVVRRLDPTRPDGAFIRSYAQRFVRPPG